MQSVLWEKPSGKRCDQNKAFADTWIGNPLISPTAGKSEVPGSVQSQCTLRGAQLGANVPDTDFGKIGRRPVRNTAAGSTLDDLQLPPEPGQPHPADVDWKRRVKSRRHFDTLPRKRPETIAIVQCKSDPDMPVPAPPKWMEDGPISSKSISGPVTKPDPDGGMCSLAGGTNTLHHSKVYTYKLRTRVQDSTVSSGSSKGKAGDLQSQLSDCSNKTDHQQPCHHARRNCIQYSIWLDTTSKHDSHRSHPSPQPTQSMCNQ